MCKEFNEDLSQKLAGIKIKQLGIAKPVPVDPRNSLRMVDYKGVGCYFHEWIKEAGATYINAFAIIEMPSGNIQLVNYEHVRFYIN